jgi:hypothetical protein
MTECGKREKVNAKKNRELPILKVECPVCHVQGILEVRGNSQRVLHYKGFFNGKRLYERHPLGVNGNNGNKSLGMNKAINKLLFKIIKGWSSS